MPKFATVSGKWSDAFFNYKPAEKAYKAYSDNNEDKEPLREAAIKFLTKNQKCDCYVNDLVEDFLKRV